MRRVDMRKYVLHDRLGEKQSCSASFCHLEKIRYVSVLCWKESLGKSLDKNVSSNEQSKLSRHLIEILDQTRTMFE